MSDPGPSRPRPSLSLCTSRGYDSSPTNPPPLAPDGMTQVVAGRVPSRRDSSNTPVVPVAFLKREDGLPELVPAGPKDAIEEGKRGPKKKCSAGGILTLRGKAGTAQGEVEGDERPLPFGQIEQGTVQDLSGSEATGPRKSRARPRTQRGPERSPIRSG